MSTSPIGAGPAPAGTPDGPDLREHSRIELIPLPSLSRLFHEIPARSRLSVTCSPAHGVEATLQATARLRELGHDAVPHLAARQITSREQVTDIAARCDAMGVQEVFCIAGDAKSPGPYTRALDLAIDYAAASGAVRGFGFAGYPEGHASIPRDLVVASLYEKQDFLASGEFHGYVSTQMCFSAPAIVDWALRERDRGLTLPLRLGVPGHVDRRKLMTVSGRLGIGKSLKFLRNNRSSVTRLMASAHFEPTGIVDEVLAAGARSGVEGLHIFSFNNVAPTVDWFDGYTRARLTA
ncbi:methylenetetrahydrofolate reductase, partial [Streptomyces sp. NPDC055078]